MTTEHNGPALALHMRIAGQATDAIELPDHYEVNDGLLALYEVSPSGEHLALYAAYNLDIIEHFEVVPADQLDDAIAKIKQAEYQEAVDIGQVKPENPFIGGKLKPVAGEAA